MSNLEYTLAEMGLSRIDFDAEYAAKKKHPTSKMMMDYLIFACERYRQVKFSTMLYNQMMLYEQDIYFYRQMICLHYL